MMKSCQWCGEVYKTSNSKSKFCSLSCFGKFSRTGKPALYKPSLKPKEPVMCVVCGEAMARNSTKYCSNKCQGYERQQVTFTKAISTGVAPASPNTLRNLTLKLLGRQCSICGITEWCGKPVPVEVDHIDGDYTNNLLSNIRLVCGNCAMQLSTYKGKNKGSGRYFRRMRYSEGKSF